MALLDMRLELDIIKINDICFGSTTRIENGVLCINKDELINEISDAVFETIDVELAKPGESVRIIPVKDVIEPRIKVENEGSFPGFFGDFSCSGEGTTKVLRGCAVVTTGSIVAFQEGIIDMSGTGSNYTIFSKINNVVIIAEPIKGIDPNKHEEALRIAGLKAAHYLAKAALNVEGNEREVYQLEEVPQSKKLPKIAYIQLSMAQGLLHDNYIYGVNTKHLHPILLHPNELMDGAEVSGNCVVASDKTTTYDHQNNPVIKELYLRHGVDLDFAGVIIVPINAGLKDKERCALGAINLLRQLRPDGVIISEEGGGNPEADIMMLCSKAEKCGIKTVLILNEVADDIGKGEPLTTVTPEADAVISTGNANEVVYLPKLEKVIGHVEAIEKLSGSPANPVKEDGSIKGSLAVIMGSTNCLGTLNLRAQDV